MPPRIERREPGVYFIGWEGVITRDQLLEFIRVSELLFELYGDARYVLIIDASKALMREYDIRTARRAVEDSRLLAVFVINPSIIIQTLIKMLRQVTQTRIEVCHSYDEALLRSHDILAR